MVAPSRFFTSSGSFRLSTYATDMPSAFARSNTAGSSRMFMADLTLGSRAAAASIFLATWSLAPKAGGPEGLALPM